MKTIGIKVKTYANEVNIINSSDIERRILHILFLSFGFLAILYVVFIGSIVFNIIERRTIEADARNINNEVMELEQNYLAMNSTLDINTAYSLGFSEAKATFATRQHIESLGMNNLNSDIKLAKNEI